MNIFRRLKQLQEREAGLLILYEMMKVQFEYDKNMASNPNQSKTLQSFYKGRLANLKFWKKEVEDIINGKFFEKKENKK